MTLDTEATRGLLRECDLRTLFNSLGWDNFRTSVTVSVEGLEYQLRGVAEKRGVQVFHCEPPSDGRLPPRSVRAKIETQLGKSAHEHLIIFTNTGEPPTDHVWQWADHQPRAARAIREHSYNVQQPGDSLIQKLGSIRFELDEEEELTLAGDVIPRIRESFGLRDKVTKKFYDEFQQEHKHFLGFIEGIAEKGDREWYSSVMLNRLMFIYFVQKKGFLDGDVNYLRNRLAAVRRDQGPGQFLSFYRVFLRRLFHEGLGMRAPRGSELDGLLGDIPYLNGGIFDEHRLEAKHSNVDIADEAFEALFAFFDAYEWHLDARPLRNDSEINPDVVGYIFEKYVNQKEMGAYYTKEDITEYISKNTVVAALLDATKEGCPIEFATDGPVWGLLKDDPDRYIYEAMRHGVDESLPAEIDAGVGDVSARDAWNHAAPAPYALPTETWREHIARRARCLDLRAELAGGEVTQVGDLISRNLDIRQFAQDVIERSDGPDVVQRFYKATTEISVLDPTCGSGAFLFAALGVLQPLYAACLERMSAWLEDEAQADRPTAGHAFEATLEQAANHPNREYFILKSIIIDNLYGVDLMEEAVEICKLRLFLKLVAQVEDSAQIEPLPDIDFNIRSGNALVGFTSLDSVRDAMSIDLRGNRRLLFQEDEEKLADIEANAELADQAYQEFREQQTIHGATAAPEHKVALRRRLEGLGRRLDLLLAHQYGVDPADEGAFQKWRRSHQPLHWFVEFYGIIRRGGFDAIIGNPPYVQLSAPSVNYGLSNYETAKCGNLYAVVWERSLTIAARAAHVGLIIPVAAVCTNAYDPLRRLWATTGRTVVSNFNDRPSKLFDGLEHIRLSVVLWERSQSEVGITHSTRFMRWQAVERPTLFDRLEHVRSDDYAANSSVAKIGTRLERAILEKYRSDDWLLGRYLGSSTDHRIYYTRKLSHFVQILDFVPSITDAEGTPREPSELKELRFRDRATRDSFLALLNSSLFYWLITVWSDCRNLNRREVAAARLNPAGLGGQLAHLAGELMESIRSNSRIVTSNYRRGGTLSIQNTFPRLSKPIIDAIDTELAAHYDFTDEELDFIVNYDIKYRMGLERQAGA